MGIFSKKEILKKEGVIYFLNKVHDTLFLHSFKYDDDKFKNKRGKESFFVLDEIINFNEDKLGNLFLINDLNNISPREPSYHGIDENGKLLNVTIPYDDRERYDFVYLHDIDKGEPFVTEGEEIYDEYIKKKIYY